MKGLRSVLLSFFAYNHGDFSLPLSNVSESNCRSNTTHIAWKIPSSSQYLRPASRLPKNDGHSNQSSDDSGVTIPNTSLHCSIQDRKDAEKICIEFLRKNIMPFDEPFTETLGFPVADTTVDTDGLSNGLVEPTIALALDAKVMYKWTDDLPIDIFLEYVLNYANLNEARTNWRPLLVEALKFNETKFYRSSLKSNKGSDQERRLESDLNVSSVTTWVNTHMWTLLARDKEKPIYFKSSQTPLIFDPMSTIAFGYASCTGTSILLCNALRAVGVPARVAGTPAWYGNRTQGNHNWVEVYVPHERGGEWKFLEPSPALPNVDTLDANPCDRWFCDSDRYPATKVYAARLSKDNEEQRSYFPLAWEWDCHDVPGIDRTDYYTRVCGSCNDNIID